MLETERRQYPRVNLVTRVTHILSDTFHYYYSRDLSLGGIFLETKKPYAVGSRLILDFTLPGMEGRLRTEGDVVRVVKPDLEALDQTSGMGISFTKISEESLTKLKNYLMENAGCR